MQAVAAAVVTSALGTAATLPSPREQTTIEWLIWEIESAGCQMDCDAVRYFARDAVVHLRMKPKRAETQATVRYGFRSPTARRESPSARAVAGAGSARPESVLAASRMARALNLPARPVVLVAMQARTAAAMRMAWAQAARRIRPVQVQR